MTGTMGISGSAPPEDECAHGYILVVDDHRPACEGLAKLLRLAGYRVWATDSAREAVGIIETEGVDLVISDVNMPGVDGYELTRRLRQLHEMRDVPVILISAIATSQRHVTALEVGADDFLEKPIDCDALLARIRMHLRRRQRLEELSRTSVHDELTGVLNRRGLIEVVERELHRARRDKAPLSLLLLDIDDFKQINDRLGHAEGDLALRRVAEALREAVRGSDTVGRLGGDEFVVVAPNAPPDAGAALALRLGECASARLSVGVVTTDGAVDGQTLLQQADTAMYGVKRLRKRAARRRREPASVSRR